MKAAAERAVGSSGAAAYEILFELGQGGMGTAFLARAAGTDGFERLVVIKRLHAHYLADSQAISRFLREARIAALIHHANVAGTQQVGSDEQGPFIVLDYVDGASFAELLYHCSGRGVSVPARIALRVGLDVLAGLEAVHGASSARGKPLGILHRDVSLENVLVGRDGVARLSDFGLAKSVIDAGSARQRYLVGKLPYISPEYLQGKPIGPAMDVYAAGVALWLVLAGTDPWPDADDAEIMRHILEGGLPELPARPGVPPELAALVMTACAPKVADRFQSAREMSDAIEWLDQEHDCVASHREVAAWLEEVMGSVLAQRRARIADFLEPGRASRIRRSAARARGATSRSRWRRPDVWLASAIVLALGAVVLRWQLGARPSRDAATNATRGAVGEPARIAPSPFPATTSPPAPAAGVPIVEVGKTLLPLRATVTEPSATKPWPGPPSTARRAPLPAAESSRRQPLLAPSSIRRTNPYR